MEGEKFVYVFSKEARNKMIAAGYKLIKSDEKNKQYIFENNPVLTFSNLDISTIKSNMLSF